MFLKILIVAIFVAVTVAVGVFARKHSNSVDGFVLGGRNVGPWLSAFAFGMSYFSAVVFIGYAGQFGWKYGMSVFWVGIGNAVIGSLLAWWVLGPRTREMTQRLKATTMPEFFGKRYNSRALRIAAAAIIFVFLIPYTASVYNGLSRLFGMAFGLPYEWCVIGMAVVTCIYVVLGGYVASVWNDFIQGTIMLIGIIAVIFAVLNGQGGIATAIVNLSQIPAEGSAMAGPFTSMFGPDALNLLGVIILTSLGTWALPQMVQKFYAIKTGPAIKQGAIISTIFALVVAGGSYFLGGFGRLYLRLDRADHARRTSRHSAWHRGGARALRVHVDACGSCAHLFFNAHTRFDQGQHREEDEREEASALHALLHRGVRGYLCWHCAGTVPFDHRVHRSVDGLFVGRAFGFVPWSLFLGLVLRSHLKASSLV